MITIILRTIRDRKWSLISYCGASLFFLILYTSIFPTMEEQAKTFMEVMQNYPQDIFAAMGVDLSQAAFSTIEGYLSMEQYSIFLPIFVMALSVAWAGSSLAGEIDKGTIEFLLAQPISRVKLFFGKYFSAVLAIIALIVVTSFSIFVIAPILGISFKAQNFVTVAFISFLFSLSILSISFFFSSIFSDKGKALFIPTGLFVLMYAFKIVSGLVDELDFLKFTSLFYYYDFQAALMHNTIDWFNVAVFGGVTIIFTGLALWIFNKRDAR